MTRAAANIKMTVKHAPSSTSTTQVETFLSMEKTPNSPLFQAIHESNWNEAMQILRQQPEQASGWAIRISETSELVAASNMSKAALESAVWKRLPLHEAVTRQPPDNVVDALLQAYPEAATFADHQKRLPLQVACVHGASKTVIYKLLTSFPESVLHRDSYGKTAAMSADACPSFPDGERNWVLEALCRSPTQWHIKQEEERCLKEEEKRMSVLKESFERERDLYKSKIDRIMKRSTDERFEYYQMKENYEIRIEELNNDKKKLQSKIDGLKQNQQDLKNELEGHIATREMEIAVLRTELANCKNSSAVLSKIEMMQYKLQTAMSRNMELEDEAAAVTKEAADLASQLENKTKSEAELKAYSEELFKDLEESLGSNAELEKMLALVTEERDQLRVDLEKALQAEKDTLALSESSDQLSRQRISELEAALCRTMTRHDHVEEELTKSCKELAKKSEELLKVCHELSIARSSENLIKMKLTMMENELDQAKQESTRLGQELAEASENLIARSRELATTSNHLVQVQSSERAVHSKMSALEAELQKEHEEREQLTQELKKVKKKLSMQHQSLSNLSRRIRLR